ncbi:hypothetical protein TIFTF001_018255 [Ficus carica]|uniref:Membrane insertase YidC/Oxa/ALB C-terminal domain-containing protein n=1 Tax=Ficus carica TaxID=3494 RepID=A0AA88DJ68_FICCA|nr:hypothetical protein TIFTF001_018255 [Ficus carica]
MTTLLPNRPSLVLSPFSDRTQSPLFRQTHYFPIPKPCLRGSLAVARLGFRPDPEAAEGVVRELLGRAEGFLYTLADAAGSSSPSSDALTTAKQNDDWLSGIANYMESVLKVLKDGLSALHVPYAYGFAIILLTVLVKAATFPLTKKQERIQLETARLYKLASINPLAGCLPTLATIPVWIGLYRALSNVADEDGHPPLGWSDTLAYLVLPVLLVVSQYISVQIMQSAQSDDPNMKSSQAVSKFLPLMIGYFALSVPSGLSLYWLTNNILSTAQQVWLQKLGGAKIPVKQFSTDVIKEDQPRVEKSIPDLTLTQKDTRKGEKLIADGLRPGDRFKQIKEQEARKRRQREEEKRKAEEAAANASQIPNERENEGGVDLIGEKNGSHLSDNIHNSSSSGVTVNGNLSTVDVKENEITTSTLDNEVSTSLEVDGRKKERSYESSGKWLHHVNAKFQEEVQHDFLYGTTESSGSHTAIVRKMPRKMYRFKFGFIRKHIMSRYGSQMCVLPWVPLPLWGGCP